MAINVNKNARLFIAINLPEMLKRRIESVVENINTDSLSSKFRFLPSDNWHITLIFLGNQTLDKIASIERAIKECIGNNLKYIQNLHITLDRLIFWPIAHQRMIWLMGDEESSRVLRRITEELTDRLRENGVYFRGSGRGFKTHITLARIIGEKTNGARLALSRVDHLSFAPQSIDLMESDLSKGMASYDTLRRIVLD